MSGGLFRPRPEGQIWDKEERILRGPGDRTGRAGLRPLQRPELVGYNELSIRFQGDIGVITAFSLFVITAFSLFASSCSRRPHVEVMLVSLPAPNSESTGSGNLVKISVGN